MADSSPPDGCDPDHRINTPNVADRGFITEISCCVSSYRFAEAVFRIALPPAVRAVRENRVTCHKACLPESVGGG